ncbi:MAG: hypothetical protein WDA03_03045 [Trueperaceae bacterium]
MKRHTLFLSLATVAALVLSACTITVEPGGPPPERVDDTVTAANNPNIAVGSYSIPAGSSRLIRIEIATGQPLVYIELNRDLRLEVLNASRTRIASSSSASFFGAGSAGLTAVDGASLLEPQGITTNVTCDGSCVILRRGSHTHVFARITNNSGSSVNVNLFAFGDVLMDDTEPQNDARNTAPTLNVNAITSGAIETLGDQDWWVANANAFMIFDAPNTALGLTLYVFNGNVQEEGPITNGQTFDVFAGEHVLVVSEADRAGPSGTSTYFISRP